MNQKEFINKIAPIAIKHGKKNNILPSLIISQGVLESASGSSLLAQEANNLFGIKKGSGWNGEVYKKKTSEQTKDGKVFYIYAEFRKYHNYEDCIQDLCLKLSEGVGWENFNRYQKIIGEKDYKKATRVLVDAGYASDVKYDIKLQRIIEQYNLTQYDRKENNMSTTLKVAVCAGHGGYKSLNPPVYATAGKRTPDGEPEWEFNDKVVRAFIEELNNYENVEVRRFDDPTGKTDVPLLTRTNKANSWGADIYISFHHNATKATWDSATGVETFTYLGSNPKSEDLARNVHPELVKGYGLKDRGIKKANLHIVRETKMPSVLLEGGFMNNQNIDIKKLRDNSVLRNAGIGIAHGVAKYANLKRKANPKPPSPPEKEKLYWDGMEFKKGQIGRVTILKKINLWKDNSNGKLEMVRELNKGEIYRVYGYREDYQGQYDLGSGMWVTKIPTHIKYETPSRSLLEKAKELYG